MNNECKTGFRKVKRLIDEKKKALKTDIEPDIHELSGAVLLQYFQDWVDDNYVSDSKENNRFAYAHKEINKLNSVDKFNNIRLCFSKKEKISKYLVNSDKIVVMLDGHVDIYNHNNDETIVLNPYSSLTLKKDDIIDFESKSDVNYYVVVEFNSPFL